MQKQDCSPDETRCNAMGLERSALLCLIWLSLLQQADEEMLLLEGIDNNGLGNWAAVSKYVGSKTAAECKEHYFEIYTRSVLCSFCLCQDLLSVCGASV